MVIQLKMIKVLFTYKMRPTSRMQPIRWKSYSCLTRHMHCSYRLSVCCLRLPCLNHSHYAEFNQVQYYQLKCCIANSNITTRGFIQLSNETIFSSIALCLVEILPIELNVMKEFAIKPRWTEGILRSHDPKNIHLFTEFQMLLCLIIIALLISCKMTQKSSQQPLN